MDMPENPKYYENMNIKPKVIIICGPTGVGKTAFAIKLALKFGGEIINCDSMQIYRYMDIGTAKPSRDELEAVPHTLIDIVDPDESFDAGMFADLASAEEERIRAMGRPVFMVGGTGLYIRSFINGLFRTEAAEGVIIETLKNEAEMKGATILHERLSQVDIRAAEKIHPNDTFRIIRALEHFEKTGKPISESWDDHGFRENRYDTLKICLNMERADLYDRINRRVEIMIQEGFVDEVRKLLEMGYIRELKSMKAIGYRHMCEYLAGEVEFDRMIELFKQDTRHYAKRQLTWFRNEKDCVWVGYNDINHGTDLVRAFLEGREEDYS